MEELTPADHRATAEALLAEAQTIATPSRRTPETRDRLIAEATLHALLALGESRARHAEKAKPDLTVMRRTSPRPTCPTCGKPLTSVSEEIMPKVRKLCEPLADDREDGKRYRRYEPCGHVVEVDEDA